MIASRPERWFRKVQSVAFNGRTLRFEFLNAISEKLRGSWIFQPRDNKPA